MDNNNASVTLLHDTRRSKKGRNTRLNLVFILMAKKSGTKQALTLPQMNGTDFPKITFGTMT
jgi:hypothetical protein